MSKTLGKLLDPIPSIAHLIWTGNKPIFLARMLDLVKISSFGKNLGNKDVDGGIDGLENHLWVDDAAQFNNLYGKRVRGSRVLKELTRKK
jgi:hypothetical protein